MSEHDPSPPPVGSAGSPGSPGERPGAGDAIPSAPGAGDAIPSAPGAGLPVADSAPAPDPPDAPAPDGPTRVESATGGATAAGGAAEPGGVGGVGGGSGAGGGQVPPPPPGASAGPGGPPGPYPPYLPPPRRRLTRSRQRRVLAGVAGGLGEYTGIDPVLFRVLFAVLTVFGGAGILLYLVGWLFLPEQDQPSAPAESLIGRGRGSDAVQAILLAVAALVVAGLLVRGDAGDIVLLALVVAGAVLLARHMDDSRDRSAPPPVPPITPPPPAPGPYEPYLPYQAYQNSPPAFPPVAPYTTAATATGTAIPTVAPEAAEEKRESSLLGRLTLSLLLLVLGVTAALDAAGAIDPQARHYLALAVGVVGLGLLVGGWRGRARGLVWLGLPLTLALVVVSGSQVAFSGGAGDRQYRPLTVAEVRDRYEVGIGNLELDLSDLDFAGRSVSTTATAGIGNVLVTVPRNVDVDVVGRAGVGEADLFGEKASGTSPERTRLDEGPDGEGGGRLRLVLDVGVGRVEVDRETA